MPSTKVLTRLTAVWFVSFWAASTGWTQAGPPGGTVGDFLLAPNEPSLVYAATNVGVFRSQDSGASWTPMRGGLPALPTVSLSGTPEQLFVAVDGGGIFRSRNGATWESINEGIGDLQTLAVANDPQQPNVVFAATRTNGVFFSDNAGEGWIRAGTGLADGAYLDLAVDPNNSQLVFAASAAGFLFQSSDGGQNWEAEITGPAAFRKIRFDPRDSNIVYTASSLGIFRRPGEDMSFETVPGAGGLSYFDIEFDPNDPMTLYAASEEIGVLRSTDSGATWGTAAGGLPLAFPFAIEAMPREPTRLLLGLGGAGAYTSDDRGDNWTVASRGLDGAVVLDMAIDPTNSSTVYASAQGGGLFKTTNGGETWRPSRNGFRHFRPSHLEIDPSNPEVLYVGSASPGDPSNGAVSRTLDGGENWEPVATGLGVLSLAANPSDGRTLWAGTLGDPFFGASGMFRSRDRGVLLQRYIDDDFILAGQDVREIALDPNDGRRIYIAAQSFGTWILLRSDNEANDFERPTFTPAITDIVVDPTDGRRIFIGTAGFGIIRSENRGEDLDAANGGFPDANIFVQSFAVDPSSGPVYAATNFGVVRSDDRGRNWTPANDGIGQRLVTKLVADPQRSGVVYAALEEGGVYKTEDRGATWAPTGVITTITQQSVVNAASFQGGGVAPGQIVSIFGLRIGPETPVSPDFDPSTGRLPTTFAGATVYFNDIPAPLFFLSSGQINCQVPFEIAGAQVVEIRVEFNGQSSSIVRLEVRESDPGLFAAVQNQDLTVNSATNQAEPSQIVILFATGQGLMDQALLSGAPAPATPPLPSPQLEVRVEVGGRPADILFVGLTPNLVGLLQLNIRLSPDVNAGALDVKLTIGGRTIEVADLVHVRQP